MVQQMALGQQVRPCGICQLVGHPTDACPTLQEDTNEHVNAMGGFPGQPRQRCDTYAITYNEGWKEHPNLRYGNQQQTVTRPPGFPYQQRQQQTYTTQPQQPITLQAQEPSMEGTPKQLVASNMQTQVLLQGAHASLKNLENIMGQIATSLSQSELQNQGKFSSNLVLNPRENANAITLRDGKTYDPPTIPSSSNDAPLPPTQSTQQDKEETPTTSPKPKPIISNYVITPLFRSRLRKTKKDEVEHEILENFRKRKLKGNEKVSVGENISAVLQKKLPPKCKDPDTLTIPCTIGNKRFERYFYILDMEDDSIPCSTPVLLGRPFLKTTRTKIDVHEGTLTMEFDGEVIRFNIFEVMQYPRNLKEDDVTTEVKETVVALNSGGELAKAVSFLELPVSHEQLQPSIKSSPKLELKPLS
ncbi:uncharacterized protein LOC133799504 [Humulus lupulus]|uniref:uncharacterized protein LOC133799504 n=1 Tax=Humulus lupulus TaxID=3486 RepID=UPI002B417B9E|nr:uncharacterized protein LOC133799504 [Humulus lupulus]